MSVPLGDADPGGLLGQLKERGIVCSAPRWQLALAIHCYNHEDDIKQIAIALTER